MRTVPESKEAIYNSFLGPISLRIRLQPCHPEDGLGAVSVDQQDQHCVGSCYRIYWLPFCSSTGLQVIHMNVKGWESLDQWLLWVCVWIPQVEIGFILLTLCIHPGPWLPLLALLLRSCFHWAPHLPVLPRTFLSPESRTTLDWIHVTGYLTTLPSFQLTHLVPNTKSLFTPSDVKSIDSAIFVLSPLLLSYFSPYPAFILSLIVTSL